MRDFLQRKSSQEKNTRGVFRLQFTSIASTKLVEASCFRKSMSRPGTPQDNQVIESFWKTMRREMPDIRQMNFDEAKITMVKFIELYYNSERLHSSIGYKSPNEFYENYTLRL